MHPGLRLLLASIVVCACLPLLGCAKRRQREALYFYSAVCPSCEESRRSLELGGVVQSEVGRNRAAVVRVYDVLQDAASQDALMAAIDAYKVPAEKQGLPLLIMDGVAYSGAGEIEAALAAHGRPGSRR